MLRWRLLLGALLIAALIALFWLDAHASTPGIYLFGLVLVVSMAAAHEVVTLLTAGGYRPLASVIYGGTALVVGSNAIGLFWLPEGEVDPIGRLGWPLVAVAVSLLAALIGEMIRYRQPGGVMVNVALAVLAVVYVGVLLSFALQLRLLGGPERGLVAVAAMVIVVKFCDTGAYSVGRLLGRHKMAPRISPGKTIEGAAGGLTLACLGAWFALTYLPRWMHASVEPTVGLWLAFGLLVGGAGMAGDLAESLFKRDMGSKDSSDWLPGFGGVLDLLDSILLAAPVAYLCWMSVQGR